MDDVCSIKLTARQQRALEAAARGISDPWWGDLQRARSAHARGVMRAGRRATFASLERRGLVAYTPEGVVATDDGRRWLCAPRGEEVDAL